MNLHLNFDRMAILLAVLCALHCLLLPFAIVLMPSLVPLGDESVHKLLLFGIIPVSLVAVLLSCKNNKNKSIYAFIFIGLAFILSPLVLGQKILVQLLLVHAEGDP